MFLPTGKTFIAAYHLTSRHVGAADENCRMLLFVGPRVKTAPSIKQPTLSDVMPP
jgi:hypothetical protein